MQGNQPSAAIKCRLVLVRHAAAEGDGRFQGQLDVPLTGVGRQQLRELVKQLSRFPVRAIYSSDLLRARATAAAVARKFGIEVESRPGLREIHFGRWQGLSWKQVTSRFPREARLWTERFPSQPIPGAEAFEDFKRRVERELEEILAVNRGRCALVITHAGVTRVILARALGMEDRNLFRIAQEPGGVNVIDYFDDGVLVRCVNG